MYTCSFMQSDRTEKLCKKRFNQRTEMEQKNNWSNNIYSFIYLFQVSYRLATLKLHKLNVASLPSACKQVVDFSNHDIIIFKCTMHCSRRLSFSAVYILFSLYRGRFMTQYNWTYLLRNTGRKEVLHPAKRAGMHRDHCIALNLLFNGSEVHRCPDWVR